MCVCVCVCATAGLVAGFEGGTEAVRNITAQLVEHGVPVAAMWLQDWSGVRQTPTGTRLWWNWEVTARPTREPFESGAPLLLLMMMMTTMMMMMMSRRHDDVVTQD